MKYKPGKGRKVRRQQKAWSRKSGDTRFTFSGRPSAPKSIEVETKNIVSSILAGLGFQGIGDR